MPLNDIVASTAERPATDGSAPEADKAPDAGEGRETTMRTPRMMPPYIHVQNIGEKSALEMYGTVALVVTLALKLVRR